MEVSYKSCRPISQEPPDRSPSTFLTEVGRDGVLRLLGELDVAGVPALQAALAEVDRDIQIDCSGLTFIDCAGLRVLEETQRACENAGARLYLIAPPRCVTRLLDLAGLEGFFEVRGGPDP
jgi:anti-anti-sigma factor